MDTWKKHILNLGKESTSIAAPESFKLRYFSILEKFQLKNNKNVSLEINWKPKNCVGWTITFLSRPLSNSEVIGSTQVNLGDFLRSYIYHKIEMKVIFTENFSPDTEFTVLWEFKKVKPYVNTTYYKFFLSFCNCQRSKVILNCRFQIDEVKYFFDKLSWILK